MSHLIIMPALGAQCAVLQVVCMKGCINTPPRHGRENVQHFPPKLRKNVSVIALLFCDSPPLSISARAVTIPFFAGSISEIEKGKKLIAVDVMSSPCAIHSSEVQYKYCI